eukprot:m.290008 g.290008  ORF g.290008 m.290008 type:complete len:64 (-) comp12226_c0_seq1:45-236(-)
MLTAIAPSNRSCVCVCVWCFAVLAERHPSFSNSFVCCLFVAVSCNFGRQWLVPMASSTQYARI